MAVDAGRRAVKNRAELGGAGGGGGVLQVGGASPPWAFGAAESRHHSKPDPRFCFWSARAYACLCLGARNFYDGACKQIHAHGPLGAPAIAVAEADRRTRKMPGLAVISW